MQSTGWPCQARQKTSGLLGISRPVREESLYTKFTRDVSFLNGHYSVRLPWKKPCHYFQIIVNLAVRDFSIFWGGLGNHLKYYTSMMPSYRKSSRWCSWSTGVTVQWTSLENRLSSTPWSHMCVKTSKIPRCELCLMPLLGAVDHHSMIAFICWPTFGQNIFNIQFGFISSTLQWLPMLNDLSWWCQ